MSTTASTAGSGRRECGRRRGLAVSVAAAAAQLHVTPRTIQRWARSGRLASREDDHHHLQVATADVAREQGAATRSRSDRDTIAIVSPSAPAADIQQQPVDLAAVLQHEIDRSILLARRVGELEQQVTDCAAGCICSRGRRQGKRVVQHQSFRISSQQRRPRQSRDTIATCRGPGWRDWSIACSAGGECKTIVRTHGREMRALARPCTPLHALRRRRQ